jgi:hypothetical protein
VIFLNEIKEFLIYLQDSNNAILKKIAKQYTEKDCDLLKRILNNEKISKDEMKIVNDKYCKEYLSASDLMKYENTPAEIKDKILDNIFENKIEWLPGYNVKLLIKNTLANFPDVSPYHLEFLFHNYYDKCLSEITDFTPTISTPSPYCDKVTSEFSKWFIDVLNKKIPTPSNFNQELCPIKCVKDPMIHNYIIKNMPKDIKTATFISTQLIDNPFVDEQIKNDLFMVYDYHFMNSNKLCMTPYIERELYNSAMETYFDISSAKHSEMSKNFLHHAISTNSLSETVQIDFVKRIISEEREKGTDMLNKYLEYIACFTESPKVLHIIFEQASNIDTRNSACLNKYISNEDLQKQADIYCNNIKNIIKGNITEISNILNCMSKINQVLDKTTIKDDNYQVLLSTENFYVLSSIIHKNTTPPHIIIEATEIIEKQYKNNKSYNWEYLLIEAKLHTELLKRNYHSQEKLTYVLKCIENSYEKYINNINLNDDYILPNIEVLCEEDFYNQVIDSLNGVVDAKYKDYIKQLTKFLQKKYNEGTILMYLKDNNLKGINVKKVEYYIVKNIKDFEKEVKKNNIFSVIEKYAQKHSFLTKIIKDSVKDIQQNQYTHTCI